MLRYEHIEFLNLLFIIPCVIIAMIFYQKWKKKAISLFGDQKLVKELMSSFSKSKEKIKDIITVLIFILLIIALYTIRRLNNGSFHPQLKLIPY